MISDDKYRKIRFYKGFSITLEYDPGDWVGISSGWVFNLYDNKKNRDYGYNWGERSPFRTSLKDAKSWADKIRSRENTLEERTKK